MERKIECPECGSVSNKRIVIKDIVICEQCKTIIEPNIPEEKIPEKEIYYYKDHEIELTPFKSIFSTKYQWSVGLCCSTYLTSKERALKKAISFINRWC